MGVLVRFELKKILNNRAGMAACALMLVMLAAIAALNLLTMDTIDIATGELVHGPRPCRPTARCRGRMPALLTTTE